MTRSAELSEVAWARIEPFTFGCRHPRGGVGAWIRSSNAGGSCRRTSRMSSQMIRERRGRPSWCQRCERWYATCSAVVRRNRVRTAAGCRPPRSGTAQHDVPGHRSATEIAGGAAGWPSELLRCSGDERALRRYHAELVPPRGQPTRSTTPHRSARCPPAARRARRGDRSRHAVFRSGRQIEVDSVLDALSLRRRHETHADRRGRVRADDTLALTPRQHLPAERPRPESSESW